MNPVGVPREDWGMNIVRSKVDVLRHPVLNSLRMRRNRDPPLSLFFGLCEKYVVCFQKGFVFALISYSC